MSITLQWIVVAVIGAGALWTLLRHFGILGGSKQADNAGACGSSGCGHCGTDDQKLADMLAYMDEST